VQRYLRETWIENSKISCSFRFLVMMNEKGMTTNGDDEKEKQKFLVDQSVSE